jgi:DNA invertase Pin-like site-specific DNA recombinase
MKNYVAYYRVSTQQQGKSGLGLEAQKKAVNDFIKEDNLLAEFTEVETGKNDNRIKLAESIELATNEEATLIIAKLDRLSRNAGFIFQLRDSGIDFVCCDIPEANTLTIGIFAVMAQHERELISQRTKAGLEAAKARGKKLGKPDNLPKAAWKLSAKVRQMDAMSDLQYQQAVQMAKLLKETGIGFRKIANKLNENGFKTRRKKMFQPTTVLRMLD